MNNLIIIFVMSFAFLLSGILLLLGKATFLIAGLNTAPKEEKEKWDEKKIAVMGGTFLLIMANVILLCFLLPHYMPSLRTVCTTIFIIITFSGTILVIFLANRYGKK